MSWITDWTSSLWSGFTDVLQAPLRTAVEAWGDILKGIVPADVVTKIEAGARKAGYGASPLHPLLAVPVYLLNIMGFAKTAAEPALQETRLKVLLDSDAYPPNPAELALLATRSAGRKDYLKYLLRRLGFKPEMYQALHEIARKTPEFDAIRALYQRGLVTDEYVDAALGELGFTDDLLGLSDLSTYENVEKSLELRGDKAKMRELFKRLPDIDSLITIQMRDAFPTDPSIYPAAERTDAWQKWFAETSAHTPEVYDWQPGGAKPLMDSLKEGTEYGPLSFEAWFQGGRERYTKTFEKVIGAQGLDPYWAMKLWEAHWKLPDYYMLRELLFRSPMFDEQRVADILRWQDYPPKFVAELVKIAYQPLTRVDTRRMHQMGVIGVPRVFKSYLEQGYNAANAMRMTAFTAVLNAETIYGPLVKEVLKSYGEGALTLLDAFSNLWVFMAEEIPAELPEWVNTELTPAQVQAVKDTYGEIQAQLGSWITQRLAIAATSAELEKQRAYLDTAKKQFIGWEWSPDQTRLYLSERGYDTSRIHGLMDVWQPLRERNERLPTQAMLEEFLIKQDMPVDVWRGYMTRLGYSDSIIMEILQGVGKLPTVAMLQSFLKARTIPPDVFIAYIMRLGYDRWTAEHMVEVILAPEV